MRSAMTAFAPSLHGLRGVRRGARQATCARSASRMVSADADSPSSSRRPGLREGEMEVRFTNTPDGEDVIAAAREGDLLLAVGDSAGLRIPRACVSGLCGSCTVDIVDADGPQTVRACQTRVVDVGTGEMVVDVARMKEIRERKRSDPMARFDNLDTEYVAGAPPVPLQKKKGGWRREMDCTACAATGDIECYACDGTGVGNVEFMVGEGESGERDEGAPMDGGTLVDEGMAMVERMPIEERMQIYQQMQADEHVQMCPLCAGSGMLRCADCQGVGIVKIG